MRPVQRFRSVLIVNVIFGVPAYFLAFLFAYGFKAPVGLRDHVAFLVMIAIFAVVSGLVGVALPLLTMLPAPMTTVGERGEHVERSASCHRRTGRGVTRARPRIAGASARSSSSHRALSSDD
jgi:hypothetical protein